MSPSEVQVDVGLRSRGHWPPPEVRCVAIVGARRPSPYGEAVAFRLALDLAVAGIGVISGLAAGIDAAAHRGAVEGGGYTVGVLGTGVDVVYPRANTSLASEILNCGGALVSQFPDGTQPRRSHFPARNWTIAALSEVVVVVEAGGASGALITAGAALSLGKEVLAVPGSVFSPVSVGSHQLLRDGAGLVQNARDVLAAMGLGGEVLDDPLRAPLELGIEVPSYSDGILIHLSEVLPVDAERLAAKLGLRFEQVLARLTALEMGGLAKRSGDGYVRMPRRRRSGL